MAPSAILFVLLHTPAAATPGAPQCRRTLQQTCAGSAAAACAICCGKHQHALRVAGCTSADCASFCAKAEFYVAASGGSDSNSGGSFAEAFATLGACLTAVAEAGGGGTCWLGPGRHDSADAAAVATSGATISGAKAGATPAILDGSVALSPADLAWRPSGKRCIYRSAPLKRPVWQLWASSAGANSYHGFDVLTPARFPNAKLSDDSVFRAAPGANSSMLYSTSKSTSGHLVEDGTHVPTMAGSGIDFTGLIAVLPLGTMGAMTQGVRVRQHGAGQNSFRYDPPPGTAGKGHTNNAFFFEGGCELLDAPSEWCYDAKTRSLHVWLDSCADPRTLSFRGKVRDYLLNSSHVSPLRLERLTLWGGTLATQQTDLELDTVEMLFPTANRRVVDEVGTLRAETLLRNNQARGTLSMTNSTLEWSDGTVPMTNVGPGAVIRNCLFRRNNYAIGDSACVSDGGNSDGMVFERNTVSLFNSFSGITPGLHSTLELNDFSGQGPDADGACVHVHIKQQNGIVLRHNWAHDSTVKGMRFDRVNSANATWGTNGTFVQNVVWACASSCFKGDYHNISSNTVFDVHGANPADGSRTPALYVLEYNPKLSWSRPGENAHTHLDSNAADSIYNVSVNGVLTLPGIHRNNVAGVPIAPMLVDPMHRNFRPRGGSALHSMGAGAYAASASAEYWVPGRQEHTTSHPIPANSADEVPAELAALADPLADGGPEHVELAWRGGYMAREHRLFVMIDTLASVGDATRPAGEEDARRMEAHVASAAPDAILPEGAAQQHMLALPALRALARRRVLWRVDAVGLEGELRRGRVWAFAC